MNDPILHCALSVLRAFFHVASPQETGQASKELWSKSRKETHE
jgi:hypothetical protein